MSGPADRDAILNLVFPGPAPVSIEEYPSTMALSQRLDIKLSQQLVMTPQLQLAIRLLQMSSLELGEYLKEEVERNPLLEATLPEPMIHASDEGMGTAAAAGADGDAPQAQVKENEDPTIGADLPFDASWGEVLSSSPKGRDEDGPGFEAFLTKAEDLHDHLEWQLNLTLEGQDREVGLLLIDTIDDNGYLSQTVEELADQFDLDPEEVDRVLMILQGFDPAGVGARTVEECLKLQLPSIRDLLPPELSSLEGQRLLATLIDRELPNLARRDFGKIATRMSKLFGREIDEALVIAAFAAIQALSPKPGLQFARDEAGYIIPDVLISQREGRFRVDLNPNAFPKVMVNGAYADELKGVLKDEEGKRFVQDNLQQARWLKRSLEQRQETILKVAAAIVRYQEDFMEQGPSALRPLVLRDIAEEVNLHESTVSRVTNGKYMASPFGIREFKFFFTSKVSGDDGDVSSTAVKEKIKALVEGEEPTKPLSDQTLAEILSKDGVKVARRTVAKYREQLGIPSSSERRRFG